MRDEDKLYNDLKDHISGVFDNYEDTTADEGWELLRQRYPEKEDRKRIVLWPWLGAAAVLLLALGLWFLPNKQQSENNFTAIKRPAQIKAQQQKQPDNKPAHVDSVVPGTTPATQNQVNGTLPVQPDSSGNYLTTQPNKAGKQAQQTNIQKLQPVVNPKQIPDVKEDAATGLPVAAIKPVEKQHENPVSATNPAVNGSINDAAAQQAVRTNPANQAVVSKNMDKFLNENPLGDKKTEDKKDRKVALSVYTATYFNYANGSDNQLNVGAGFTSDFKLSNRLKLVTGVAIAQNSLNYNSDRPTSPGRGDKMYASAPVVSSSPSAAYNLQASVPVTTSYNASMVGLDIPLNLKYQFNPDKNDAFISAGLSSGTFINETYTTNYNYLNTNRQSVQKNSFNKFDLARTLNVSFGMGYPLGKRNRLIVEPFLKYPLGGLGEQNIRFGAGGVNLKLNFIPGKK